VPGTLKLRVLSSTERSTAERIWTELERRLGAPGLACSWAWTSTYLEHYDDVVDHVFVVGERDGTPVGIALVTRTVRRMGGVAPVRTQWIGTAGEPNKEIFVEYNRLLVGEDDRSAFARALVVFARNRSGWDELRVPGLVTEDAAALLQGQGWHVRPEPCPVMDLDQARGAGDVLALLGKGSRYRVNRSLRGLEPITSEWAETEAHALDILEELTALHEGRWRPEIGQGVLGGKRAAPFHRKLLGRLMPSGSVVLFRARGRTGTIGCIYGFVEHGRLLQYQSGFASLPDNKLKPGLATHVLCMREAVKRQLSAYDFLAGDQRYKRELSTSENELLWASTWARRPRSQALGLLHRAHHAAAARKRERTAGG
jgi:hypothetical protein